MSDHQIRWLMQQAWIDGDVIAIGDHTWAIHGAIPVDGEVILAEFDTPEEALAVLERVADADVRNEPRTWERRSELGSLTDATQTDGARR